METSFASTGAVFTHCWLQPTHMVCCHGTSSLTMYYYSVYHDVNELAFLLAVKIFLYTLVRLVICVVKDWPYMYEIRHKAFLSCMVDCSLVSLYHCKKLLWVKVTAVSGSHWTEPKAQLTPSQSINVQRASKDNCLLANIYHPSSGNYPVQNQIIATGGCIMNCLC